MLFKSSGLNNVNIYRTINESKKQPLEAEAKSFKALYSKILKPDEAISLVNALMSYHGLAKLPFGC